jgi:hypothetical protein
MGGAERGERRRMIRDKWQNPQSSEHADLPIDRSDIEGS